MGGLDDALLGSPGGGPAVVVVAFKATAEWLHAAFEGLRWEVRELVAEDDVVVARTVMHGRQVAPFASYGPDGRVAQVFASNGRSFAASQSHCYRVANGRIVWHAAQTGTTSARPGSSAGCRPVRPC